MKPDNEQNAASTFAKQMLFSNDEDRAIPPKTIADLLAMPGIEDIEIEFERSTNLVKPANFYD